MAAVAESSGGLGVALLWLGDIQVSILPSGAPSLLEGGWRRGRPMSLTVFRAYCREVPGVPSGDSCQPRGGWVSEGFLGQQDLGEGLSSLLEKSG